MKKQKIVVIGVSLLLGVGAVLAVCPTCSTQSQNIQPPVSLCVYRCASIPGCLNDGALTECMFYEPARYTQVICTSSSSSCGNQIVPFEQCYQHSILLCQTGG